MIAVVAKEGRLSVQEVATPVPGPGEVLLEPLACGVCGSDIHMLYHTEALLEGLRRGGLPIEFDAGEGIVYGHEFCARVLEYGPETERKYAPGTRVVSIPYVISPEGFEHVGYSNRFPGAFGEKMILPEALLIAVPDGLPSDVAALTEPLAVGAHALNRGGIKGEEAPIVIGCGPIGLSVIAALKGRGIEPIVAADFSASRREAAKRMGAHVVVDPAHSSVYDAWLGVAAPGEYDPKSGLALFGLGPQPKPCVVFDCVGVPGLIQEVMSCAPPRSTLVVVGVCMQSDSFEPVVALGKEMNIHFSFGYTVEEFAQTLEGLADGSIRAEEMITSRVGLAGVAEAFEGLTKSQEQIKVMVTPGG